VTFQVDADGLLAVSAVELSSGVHAEIAVRPSYGLSDDEVARMLHDSFGAADADMQERELREQQVEAQRLIEATVAALRTDGDLLAADESVEVERLLAGLRATAQGRDTGAIKQAIDALAKGTDEFAARRMDRSIRVALAGRRVEEVASAVAPAK
jgi:molecular chaperone HscA